MRKSRLMFLYDYVSRWSLKKTLLVGLVIRLLLMPFTAHPFDVYAWYVYCRGIIQGGLNFGGIVASLRPLWNLTLIPIAYLYGFLSSITGLEALPVEKLPWQMNPQFGATYVTDPLFNFLVKIPMLVADVGTTLVLYRIVAQFFDEKTARKMALLFYLNPICIWISAGWGQFESILAFFTLLSLYFLLKKKMAFSALSLLVATLYKVYPIAFIIPATIYLVRRSKRVDLIRYYIVLLVPILLYLLVGGVQAVNVFSGFILGFFSAGTFFGFFGFGLTYWSVSMLYPLDPNIWARISDILMITTLPISFFYGLKAKFDDSLKDLTIVFFIVFSAILLSYRYIGETRFLFLLPFLTLMLAKKAISGKVYASLSFIAFLYTQKNFPYYLLPIATVDKNLLVPLFRFAEPFGEVTQNVLVPTPLGAVILAVLGTLFSILLLKAYVKGIKALESLP